MASVGGAARENLLPQPNNLLQKEIQVLTLHSMIVDCHTQAMLTVHCRVGDNSSPLVLEPEHNFSVQRLQLFGRGLDCAETEADDSVVGRRHEIELWLRYIPRDYGLRQSGDLNSL